MYPTQSKLYTESNLNWGASSLMRVFLTCESESWWSKAIPASSKIGLGKSNPNNGKYLSSNPLKSMEFNYITGAIISDIVSIDLVDVRSPTVRTERSWE